jgi:four helix bundle protein
MNAEELKKRTRQFALRVIRLFSSLPRTPVSDVIGRQLLRAGTSVGANYRAACKARSAAEFAARMGIVEEEADECVYWIDLLIESGAMPRQKVGALQKEATELVAIAASSRKTSRRQSR